MFCKKKNYSILKILEKSLNIPISPFIYKFALYKDDKGQYWAAMKLIDLALTISPDNGDYLALQADICDELGLSDQYCEILLRLHELYGEKYDTFFNLAECEKERGNTDKAIEYYEKSLKINPNDIDVLNNYGVLIEKRNINKALLLYKKAYKNSPDDSGIINNLANCYKKIGNSFEAEKLYKKAFELPDLTQRTRYNYAVFLYEQNNYDEALKNALIAVEKDPESYRHYYLLGCIYEELGKLNLAIEYYEKAMALGSDRAKDALFELKKANE